ncbi:hypothetical protein [Nostoc punctiforme]|uniref:PEP-CTERM protein-sorting domain-containing protein n=1 Tax=Nostoc punctiforme (strain ATCC 29133 / PCC 73102) TaxID=63737 RepID=B2JAZ5_NOSP7|nr:hypothetical protein [Nostoc punctiforme]ACC85099.1 hypothetical protein Npun_AR244 [Nostoc punctiforme PCC 73102]
MSQAIEESIVSENNLFHHSTKFSQTPKLQSLSQYSFNFWQKSLRCSIFIASAAGVAIALSISVILPSKASTISYSGDTTNAPTFNRPQTEGFEGGTNPPTSLSSNGTTVSYYSQPFSVNTTGSYNVAGSQNFLGIQFLYQNSFNPITPLDNLLNGNDPFPDEGTSSFSSLSLTANNQYFLVTTGFDNSNNSFGTFTNTITGPGNIALGSNPVNVPEPSSIASTIAFGIFGSSFILKRKLRNLKTVN